MNKPTAGAAQAMRNSRKYPHEWTERIPAEVFACLISGEMRIILLPGVGLANGGAPRVLVWPRDE